MRQLAQQIKSLKSEIWMGLNYFMFSKKLKNIMNHLGERYTTENPTPARQ